MENQQKEKIHYGDYQLLAEILDISSDAARKRFERKEKGAVKAMRKIQENRKQFIESCKNTPSID